MFIDRFVRFIPKSGFKKALGFFNKGEYRKACKEFEAYLSKSPSCMKGQEQEMVRMYIVESYVEYSKELISKEKYEEAAAYLEKAIELQPGYADVHFALGDLREKMGKREQARESFMKALEINPNYFRAHVMIARSYSIDNNDERAIKELESCLSSAPTFYLEQVHKLIELIRSSAAENEREEIFRFLLEEKPSSSQVSKQIALEAIQNGDYDYALVELKKAISMHPNYPDLHNLLGIAYANKGMTDDALMEFETALKLHPNYLKARLNIALTLYEKGALDQSMDQLKQVLKLDPENELARNLMNELQPILEK
ncbi:MAG: tetratricopeptide repeat protein [bacterium]|nr:MAG: tetratricopeptide repeat protein [bacterium]